VEEENFHLTLKFFADCPEENVEELKALSPASRPGIQAVEIELRGLAAVPDLSAPRLSGSPSGKEER